MPRFCVYLGSRDGNDPQFLETTRELGRELARRGHVLVYGGARIGLMGALADAAMAEGAR